MSKNDKSLIKRQVSAAIQHYWWKRGNQARGLRLRGSSDQGARGEVTGGKQMDGFVTICRETFLNAGFSGDEIFYNSRVQLPGYYRAEKQWDVVVVADNRLIAAIEFKSQASSFGNNLNNRAEEAIGSATDLLTAYREGLIPLYPKPWLGYLMLYVASEETTRAVRVYEPHFEVSPDFKEASYLDRCRILLTKLMREQLYAATCLITTPQEVNYDREEALPYQEPEAELSIQNFIASLKAQAEAFQATRNR